MSLSYRRILILGNNGSGKSTFARALANITGLPVVHLDTLFWGPNWAVPTQKEWYAKNRDLIASDAWILDGLVDHGGTLALRFAAADLVIFLDVCRAVCVAGVLTRQRKKNRTDIPHYLKERYDKAYLRFLKGIWTFPAIRGRAVAALRRQYPDTPFLTVRGRRGINALLQLWKQIV